MQHSAAQHGMAQPWHMMREQLVTQLMTQQYETPGSSLQLIPPVITAADI